MRKKDSSLEKIGDKDKELEKEKDDQISMLKEKIEELNKIIVNQQEELDQNIREFKQVKLAYDLLQDSIEKEKNGKQKGNEKTGDFSNSQSEPSLLCSDSALTIRTTWRGNASCGRWFHPSQEDRRFQKRRRGWIPARKWRSAWARERHRFSGPTPGSFP